MKRLTHTSTTRSLVAAVVLALALGACGGDDGDSPTAGQSAGETAPNDAPEIEGSVSDDDLVVSRAYLQGEWCDSEGDNWIIEGDTATLDDGSGGTAEFPIDILFIDGVDVDLFSQTDDQFVFGSADEQVTFTRGSC